MPHFTITASTQEAYDAVIEGLNHRAGNDDGLDVSIAYNQFKKIILDAIKDNKKYFFEQDSNNELTVSLNAALSVADSIKSNMLVFSSELPATEEYVDQVMTTHLSDADPHIQYLKETDAVLTYATPANVVSAINGHTELSDPHPQYLTSSEGNSAYSPLVHVHSVTDFTPAGADATKVLWGDNRWAKPLINIEESSSTARPRPYAKIVPTGLGIHTDLVLSPKGQGAFVAHAPDGTGSGGNDRGQRAIDLQLTRSDATQVASGLYSVIVGGYSNVASGPASVCIGGHQNSMTADYSVSLSGRTGTDRGLFGSVVRSLVNNSVPGMLQTRQVQLSRTTSSTAVSPLTANGATTPTANNVIVLPFNSAVGFRGTLIARKNTDCKMFSFSGMSYKGSTHASVVIVPNVIYEPAITTSGAGSWTMSVSVDTTLGAILFNIAGASGIVAQAEVFLNENCAAS